MFHAYMFTSTHIYFTFSSLYICNYRCNLNHPILTYYIISIGLFEATLWKHFFNNNIIIVFHIMVKIQPIIVWYHVVSQIFNNITYALGHIPHTVLCKSTLMNIFIKGEFLSRIVLTSEVFLYILSKCFPKTLQSFTLLPAVFESGHCTVWWVISHVMTTAIKPTHPPTNQQTLARPRTTTQGWFVHADHVGLTQHCLSNDSKDTSTEQV